MPNHITNIISVTGNPRAVKEFTNPDLEFTFSRYIQPKVSDVKAHREAWGTKWDAYEVNYLGNRSIVQFNTAWNHPDPVLKAMSKAHPELSIEVKYADEDIGSNFGHYIIKDGEKVDQPIEMDDVLYSLTVIDNYGDPITEDNALQILELYCYLDDPVNSIDDEEVGSAGSTLINYIGLEKLYTTGNDRMQKYLEKPYEELVINKKLSIFIDKIDSNG
jgi:hypothetical protein